MPYVIEEREGEENGERKKELVSGEGFDKECSNQNLLGFSDFSLPATQTILTDSKWGNCLEGRNKMKKYTLEDIKKAKDKYLKAFDEYKKSEPWLEGFQKKCDKVNRTLREYKKIKGRFFYGAN